MDHNDEVRLKALLDREEIFDLVRRERFARDQRRYDVMRACFHDDAHVRTSWYDGRGAQAYVDASRESMGINNQSKHWVFPAICHLNGDRATVESPATIFNRLEVHGVESDFHVYCRFFSRVVRESDRWKLLTFEVLWEWDTLGPVDLSQVIPVDQEVLAGLRPSYKHLAYVQQQRGIAVNPDLIGDDRPDELAAFYAREQQWLEQG